MGDRALVIRADSDCIRATWHNLSIVIWRGTVSDQAIQGLTRQFQQMKAEHGSTLTYLGVISEGIPHPNPGQLRKLGEAVKEYGKDFKFVAMVFEATGLASSVARIAFNASNMVVPAAFPKKGFPDLVAAAQAIAPYITATDGRPVTPRDVISVVNSLPGRQALPRVAVG